MHLVTRAHWRARSAWTARISRPVGVAFHWGGPAVGIRSHADCARKVRSWQRFHMDGRGWADIAYNAVVCPHGYVYEGRGVDRRSAANGTKAANRRYYAVCYLGGEGDPLTDAGRRGLCDARAWLMGAGGAGSAVRSHRSFKRTSCPGDELAEWVAAGCPRPHPPTPTKEDDDMQVIVKEPGGARQYLTNGLTRVHLSMPARQFWIKRGVPYVGEALTASDLARIPDVTSK